ncbi:hypothetical protein ACFONG_15090 [Uliginosibacterium paludis]|uniref:Uncharacterized protein n=1 Tax=Uliginosibacterium paludis TaxID=1615952 RepID=A0ABV2CTI1_9RHOO
MTIIDTTPIKTLGDLKSELARYPDDCSFEIVFKTKEGGTALYGVVDMNCAIHQVTRLNDVVLEIVAQEI